MKNPIHYLLVGLPYSGKTTLGKALEEKLGFAHINIDQLKFDRGYTDVGDDDVPDKVWEEIFEEADALLVKYLQEGKNVANEYAWITREWRDRARNVAEKAGFATKIIYIKLSEEIIRQRRDENEKSKARFHWDDGEFEQILKDFEELSSDEDFIVYDQTISFEVWAEKYLE